jgi:hypothetical protein
VNSSEKGESRVKRRDYGPLAVIAEDFYATGGSIVQEDETHAVQSFVISTEGQAEFAHRALVTLLRTFGDVEPLDWHKILVRKQLPLLFASPHQAVRKGLEAGFIKHRINIRPQTWPEFVKRHF